MIGRSLSHYRILSKLGEGGMGEVFLAEDTELGREVALKLLAADVASDPERVERFRREAKAVAALNHPNIVTIHSIEESEGIRFLTMERVEGESLDRRIPAGGLPLGTLFDLAIPLADALAAAHARGIVHRDLKPANVMVTRDGRPKVLDFGLAKLASELDAPGESDFAHGATRSVPLTGEGMMLGTAPYMSPEQLQARPVDHRSDIFSLGVVLYEMATGQRPFRGESTIALASSIVRDAPRPLTEARGDAPRHLSRIVEHCLAKDPEDRFQSAKDVRNELRALREEWKSDPGEIREQTRPSGVPAAATPARAPSRRSLWLGVAAGIALLALAGIWLARRGSERASSPGETGPKRIAVLPFENLGAPEDSYFADGMTDEVRSKLAGLSGLAVIARSSADQYKGSTKPPDQIARELGVRYLLTATVRWQKSGATSRIRLTPELVELGGDGAPTTRWQEGFEAELSDVFRVQGEVASRVAQALELALSGAERGRLSARPTSNVEAYDAYLKGEEIERAGISPATLRAAATQYERAVALDPGFAQAWAQLSSSRSELYRITFHTTEAAAQAKAAAERALELDSGLAKGYAALGDYYRKVERDTEKARDAYRNGLRIAPDDVALLRAAGRGFGGYTVKQIEEEILPVIRRARDLDPRSWESEHRLGSVLVNLHRPREAREAFERGLALAPGNLSLINSEITTWLQEGDLAGARRLLAAVPPEVDRSTLAAYVATYGDQDWVLEGELRERLLRLTPEAFDNDRGSWAFVLAQAAGHGGDEAKKREYAAEAVKNLPLLLAPDDAQRRVFLGLSLAYLGRDTEARKEAEQGAALAPLNKYVQHQLARVYIEVGDQERALDILEAILPWGYDLTPARLRIDPNFDPLRGNPRFQKLVSGA